MSIIPVYDGQVVDEDNAQAVCDAIEARIVELQNDNYASPKAQALLELESQIVLEFIK